MPDPHIVLTPEVLAAARFRKSRRSDNTGSCVQVADNLVQELGIVLVGDSKHPGGPKIWMAIDEFNGFTAAVEDGDVHPWICPCSAGVEIAKDGVVLSFTPAEWSAFRAGVRDQEFALTRV